MTYGAIAIVAPFVIGLPLLGWAAKRFGDRRRRAGEWDAKGPLHPTAVPVAFLKPKSSIKDLAELREELHKPEVRHSKRSRPDA